MRESRLRFGCLALLTQNRPAVSVEKCVIVDRRLRFGTLGTDQTFGVPAMVVVECKALVLNGHSARRTQVRGHLGIDRRLSLDLTLELVPVSEFDQFVEESSNNRRRVVLPFLDTFNMHGVKFSGLVGRCMPLSSVILSKLCRHVIYPELPVVFLVSVNKNKIKRFV